MFRVSGRSQALFRFGESAFIFRRTRIVPETALNLTLGALVGRGVSGACVLPPLRRVLPSRRHRFPWPELPNAFEDGLEEPPWRGDLGHLEDHVSRMQSNLRFDLDQLFPKSRCRVGISDQCLADLGSAMATRRAGRGRTARFRPVFGFTNRRRSAELARNVGAQVKEFTVQGQEAHFDWQIQTETA